MGVKGWIIKRQCLKGFKPLNLWLAVLLQG